MSGKYKFHNPKGMYFVSWAVVYWIDVLCAMNTVCYLLKVWTIVAKTHQSDINPVEAGFVDKAEDWRYGSSRDYSGLKGLLEMDFIE